MRATRHLLTSFIVLALLVGNIPVALSQGRVAIEKKVRLSSGKTRTLRGKADSSTSYVYKLKAEKDRRLEARVSSEGGAATFSIVPPGTQVLENAMGVKEWSGALPETGEYSIIVAITTSGAAEIPYTLELTLR